MATKTLGTVGTTTLTAVQIPPTYNATPAIAQADWATMMTSIFDDSRNPQQLLNQQVLNEAFQRSGLLYVPNRGVLRCLPGDWVAVDGNGWPILVGYQSLPQTLTVTGTLNTNTSVTSLSANVLTQGWWAGMAISGTNVGTGNFIKAIAANGLSLTLTKAATGGGAQTLTVGSWTHS
jgi:hypothetical protein